MDFKQKLKEKRPSLTESTLKTYQSILNSLWKKVYGKEEFTMSKFNKVQPLKEKLDEMSLATRKTTLSALYVLTGNEDFRKLMMEDIEKTNGINSKQEMNEKQKEAYVSQEDLHNRFLEMDKQIKAMYKSKDYNFGKIQEYIILALLSGIYIPPRRSLDYTAFKIKNIDKENDNYFDKNKLYFNKYKTSNKKGQQVVDVPKELVSILKKWISINPTEYLLFDTNKNPMSSVKLNQKLQRMFGKKVGINTMRHSYMTDKYGALIHAKQSMADDFEKMGSSEMQEKVYIQKK